MAKIKRKSLYIRNAKLWPSTLYAGNATVRFLTGKRGRVVVVEYSGRGKPRHKRLTNRGET